MIFASLGPQYYEETHRTILQRMEISYSESITINQSFWGEADTDTRFYVGDQTLFNEIYGNLPANRRSQFTFNRIRPIVNMVSGFQRRNRKSTIVTPIENADNETADQFTRVLYWVNQQEGVLDTISDAFLGSLITGMNLLQVWVDFRSDPINGNIRVDNCSFNSFLIDPFFKKADLSDCNYIWKRTYLTQREVISLLPDKADEILGLWGKANRDGKFQFQPESYDWTIKNFLTYDEYYYRDYRTQRMLADVETGETMEWRGKDEEELKAFLRKFPSVTIIEQEIPTVKLCIVVQGRVMYDGPQPLGIDSYPFVPVLSYYHPEIPYYPFRVQGMVRNLRDSQYLYNRRMIISLDIMESTITTGWIYKENALVNPADVFNLSGQGKGLALKEEAQMTDVQQIQPPNVPPSMMQMNELLGTEMQNISGVNEELLGSAVDEKAGILSMLRQGAGITGLQILFDHLDKAQKLLGKVMIDIIQSNWTPGKIKKILGGEEPAPQFYNKAFGKYGASVEEGFDTTTQKQMQFAQLLQLKELGVNVPDDVLLDAATIQNKKKLTESIKQQQEQQQQMEQQQIQAQMEEQKARTELAQARAIADKGLGLERVSRVEENRALAVERRAEAIKDQEIGLLNFVKALKEIDHLDLDHLGKLITMSSALKQVEQAENSAQTQPEEKRVSAKATAVKPKRGVPVR
jgi:hypothetical protein